MTQATSTLSAHRGAQLVTRQELRGIAAPPSTATWRPIGHAELVDIMQDRLEAAGWSIRKEQFAVQTEGLKLFGTLDLENGHAPGEGLGAAIGFRHGNDKSMALQIVAGARVFVCDNLALSGDTKLFRSRHKHGVFSRLREALGGYFGKLGDEINLVKDRFGVWQAADLTDDQAKVLIYDAIQAGIIPARIRPDVHQAYFQAEDLGYADSAPRTKLGLHNAFTRAIKALNPAPSFEANVGLTKLLG